MSVSQAGQSGSFTKCRTRPYNRNSFIYCSPSCAVTQSFFANFSTFADKRRVSLFFFVLSCAFRQGCGKNKRANIFFHSRFAVPFRSLFTSFRPVFQDTSAVLSAFPVRQPRLRCNRFAGGERGTGNGYSSKHGMGRPAPYEPAGRISRGKNLSGMFIPESKNRKPGTEEFISTLHAGLCYADLRERLADASHYD